MALIFLGVLIVLSFQVSESDCLDFIANDEWPQVIQFTGLSALGAMLESYHELQRKPKNSSRVLKCTSVNLVCLTGESH